jgi:DNA transformation protein
MFALAHDELIYLKADGDTVAAFEREGQGPFTYSAKNRKQNRKRAVMSYWRMPDRLYDDPDELARWAREALAAAHRCGRAEAKRRR